MKNKEEHHCEYRKKDRGEKGRRTILRPEHFSGDLPVTATQRCNIQTTFLRPWWRLACTYHRWLHGGDYVLSSFSQNVHHLSLSFIFLALANSLHLLFVFVMFFFVTCFSLYAFLSFYLTSNVIYRKQARRATVLLDFHLIDHLFAHEYRVTRG